MSMTQTKTLMGESAAYGGFVDAVGGLTTIVLAVVGLTHTAPEMMVGIATIVFGAALLIQGGTMLSEYAQIIFPPGTAASSAGQFGGGSLSSVFLAGAAFVAVVFFATVVVLRAGAAFLAGVAFVVFAAAVTVFLAGVDFAAARVVFASVDLAAVVLVAAARFAAGRVVALASAMIASSGSFWVVMLALLAVLT